MTMNLIQVQHMENELFKEVVRVCDQFDVLYYAAYGTVLGAIRHGGIIPWDDDIDIYVPENELDHFLAAMEQGLGDSYWVDYRTPGHKHRDFPRVGYKGYDTELLHVDVFPLAGAPADRKAQKRLRWISGNIHLLNNVKRKGVANYKGKGAKARKAALAAAASSLIPLNLSVRLVDYFAKKYPYDAADYVGSAVSKAVGSIVPKEYFGEGVKVNYEDFEIRVPAEYDKYLTHMYRDYHKYPPEEAREAAMRKVYHVTTNPKTGLKSLR